MNALILAAASALALLTVNQGVAGSSPASGARFQGLAAVSAFAASNTSANVQNLAPSGREIRVQVLDGYVSKPGEALDAFMVRVAPVAMQYTQEHNAEVCGQIARSGDVFSVVLSTNRSQVFCHSDPRLVLPGHDLTGETLHTHSAPGADGVMHFHAETQRTAWIVGLDGVDSLSVDPGFSPRDYDGGAGYVVDDGRVLHQSGRGTDRDVGDVGEVPIVAELGG